MHLVLICWEENGTKMLMGNMYIERAHVYNVAGTTIYGVLLGASHLGCEGKPVKDGDNNNH